MKLRDWRQQNGFSAQELATKLGVGVSTITAYENGARRPRPELAKRIEVATNGEVTAAELLGLDKPAKGVREDPAPFDHDLKAEAKALGLDPDAIAAKAVEDAVKRKRIEAWNEENREAIESWNEHYRKNGLWNDRYRLW